MVRSSAVILTKAPPAGKGPARTKARDASGSLGIQVTERIRAAIQDGEFKLGEALSELKLAAALGVSRTPVREALNVLQLQGLIEIRPQAGSFVFMPSEEDVGEICVFRRLMETNALRLSFARRREETLIQLRNAVEAMERAQDAGDRLAMARADTAFHQCIAENSGNVYLINAYALISGRIAALRTYNVINSDPLRRSKAMTEHRAMVAALAKGDLERAEVILDEHVSRMRIVFLAARRHEAGTPGRPAPGEPTSRRP
jgi:DNA-binding GntR family transcriptional regulator